MQKWLLAVSGSEIQKPVNMRFYLILSLRSASPRSLLTQACVWCQKGCVYGVKNAVLWCQEGCVYGVRKAVCYFKVLILLWLSGARRVQSPSEHSNTGSSWISSLPCLWYGLLMRHSEHSKHSEHSDAGSSWISSLPYLWCSEHSDAGCISICRKNILTQEA
jgi:hypothetical protein